MFSWANNLARSTLSTVTGSAEPNYGPDAVRSVAKDAESTPFTEISKEDLEWKMHDYTSVETKTFYLMADSGEAAMIQIIYSNVAYVKVTGQFVTKIFYRGTEKPPLWCSDELVDFSCSQDRLAIQSDNMAVELSEDEKSYTIKSMTNEAALVNLTITRSTPGFVVGKDGTTKYGTDPEKPWGHIRHAFWPRCSASGTVTTKEGQINFDGRAFFVHAVQGMKPHHAASRWNFADFQGETISAVMMEFTTPPSYGSTVVNVGGIVKDGEIICAGCENTATHLTLRPDPDSGWEVPETVKYTWSGRTHDGKSVEASIEGSIESYLDRVDVMAEVPAFVKSIISAAIGAKPFVFQYSPTKVPLSLKLTIGDESFEEKGDLFCEATFI